MFGVLECKGRTGIDRKCTRIRTRCRFLSRVKLKRFVMRRTLRLLISVLVAHMALAMRDDEGDWRQINGLLKSLRHGEEETFDLNKKSPSRDGAEEAVCSSQINTFFHTHLSSPIQPARQELAPFLSMWQGGCLGFIGPVPSTLLDECRLNSKSKGCRASCWLQNYSTGSTVSSRLTENTQRPILGTILYKPLTKPFPNSPFTLEPRARILVTLHRSR